MADPATPKGFAEASGFQQAWKVYQHSIAVAEIEAANKAVEAAIANGDPMAQAAAYRRLSKAETALRLAHG